MAVLSERELGARIKGRELAGAYLLYGSEVYLSRFYADRMAKQSVGELADFNYHRFDGAVPADEIVAAASTLPFMSEYTFVEVVDYPFSQVAEGELAQLRELIDNMGESAVVLFRFEDTQFNAKVSKCRTTLEHFKNNGFAVEFARKESGELVDIICKRAQKRGANMHPSVARHLVELVGVGLDNLLSEADKLFDYCGRRDITADDVDAVAVRTADASAFHLAKAICSGNSDRVLGICHDLLDSHMEPVAIVAALSATYVDMYRSKLAEAAGLRAEDIAKEFGYGSMSFKLRNASKNAHRMSISDVRNSLDALADADSRLKSNVCDATTAVEQLLVRLMRIASR